MFNTLDAILQQQLPIVNSIPAFGLAYTQFRTNVSKIRTYAAAQSIQIEGYAVQKSEVKEEVAQHASIVAATISAYANSLNDEILRRKVDYSKDDLFKMRDVLVMPVIDTIISEAATHAAALVDFGLTPAIMTTLNTTFTTYSDLIDDPTNAINDRIDATFNLGTMIDETNELLRAQMDKNAKIFVYSAPAFYRKYVLGRRIIDLHGPRKVTDGTLRGVVRDSVTNLVIEGAVVEVVGTEIMLSTNALGEFSVDLAPGTYNIEISKDEYTDQQMTDVVIARNQDMIVNVLLEEMV
jgi:hypothetical protein